ncbi:hypothetical protein BDV98DRAFT_568394 [Pterulicium gracile]|uniref:Uncharacterized protein n=1 Tax=Pterulicium gracile TaxID=1884261 RepID=A0A5C3QGC6_9AGAR|nr:hypothetical protein BDV98DRAFT_568394 [Pterula gracilis]
MQTDLHPSWDKQDEIAKKKLRALESALVMQPPVTSGTVSTPREQCVVYYDAKDGTSRKVDLSKATISDLDALQEACGPAYSGINNDVLLKKVGILGVGSFFPTLQFPELHALLERVRNVLTEGEGDNGKALVAELSGLHTFGIGASVQQQKTTAANDTLATLVVILPTPHSGGDLVIKHAGDSWVFGLGGSNLQPSSDGHPTLGYVAFYNDVEQELLPVKTGCRVTLTYVLRWVPFNPSMTSPAESHGSPSADPTSLDPKLQRLTTTLSALLANSSVLPEGGAVGFYLQHRYPISERICICKAYWTPCIVVRVGKSGERGVCEPRVFPVVSEDDC